MNIQACSPVFTGNIIPKTQTVQRQNILSRLLGVDTFVRTTFDIKKDLKDIRLKEKINEGRSREVYTTNFDGIVVGLAHGMKFKPKELKECDDPNGLILAKDDSGYVCLMKYIQGEPLYGKDWKVFCIKGKTHYMDNFDMILNLPDETFAEYIRNVIKIRKSGYNIDTINPNNYILKDNHIGIVDLEKCDINPIITLNDFDPFINNAHLLKVLTQMNNEEIIEFANKIRTFYTRMRKIAAREGYNLSKPSPLPYERHIDNAKAYLYCKQFKKLKNLINYWHNQSINN